MAHITANDLKTRGIAAIEGALAGGRTEAVVSVRGADRFVVMDMAQYQHLRECELEAALAETRAEIAAGRSMSESPAEHVARLKRMNATAAARPRRGAAGTGADVRKATAGRTGR